MRQFIFIAFLFILLASCDGQIENEDKYNTEFNVENIPDVKDFLTLNKSEKSLDSMFNSYDNSIDTLFESNSSQSLIKKRNFIDNRSRLLLTEISNGVENVKNKDNIEKDGFSMLCDCCILKDTLFINSGIGFFGGSGISVKVYQKQFKSVFYEYTDDVKPYKLTLNSEFTDNISVESEHQYLQFDNQPNYKMGQQLTGLLRLTSKDFYEKRLGEKLDTTHVKVQLKFTCKTKQLTE